MQQSTSTRPTQSATIVEVGPRDGFQSIAQVIPTGQKIALIRAIHAAGVRRIEATSFVSPSALPQMADAEAIVAFAQDLPDLDCQVLIPSLRHAERALAAGARHLSFVVSVSEAHNLGNVRRTPAESVADYRRIVELCPAGAAMRINIATAFDCPHQGTVPIADVLGLMDAVVAIRPDAEFALCDTTGRADPGHVGDLFATLIHRFGRDRAWAFHGHDTYGLGAANVWAAWQAGVRTFDAALAGLGGCPYAPGAKGNVATEDLVWMFERGSITTGIDLPALVDAARDMAQVPGAETGGRVRDALAYRARKLGMAQGV
jgi:hydroxymethylglutaryl-CoA lyase